MPTSVFRVGLLQFDFSAVAHRLNDALHATGSIKIVLVLCLSIYDRWL